VKPFLENVFSLTDAHIQKYIERKFSNLMISFGCTGGQHRSVYCAERLAEHIAKHYDVRVLVSHREQGVEKEL
jgi:RNase adaptor protein for sRNA GlmZ degradation